MGNKSECVKEKEQEHTIENHRLTCSEELEIKQKLERIARENGHKVKAKSAYNVQAIHIIDERLREWVKKKRVAKETDKKINTETQPIESEYDIETCAIRKYSNSYSRRNLWDAKEEEDNFPTFPHFQLLSPNIPPPASPPPDLLDDFNPDSQQQQHTYFPHPEYENNTTHFQVLSPYIPPPAIPPPQGLNDDFNPGNQEQHIFYYTPSDIESNELFGELSDEDLPPNAILPQPENPAPPPPDYLE